jgi:hypothetical protein
MKYAIALLLFAMFANAATYHVSQSTGDDNSPGLSPAQAWKTLKQASRTYQPGDRILLKSGDSWNEELRPLGEGTAEKPIIIGAYGKGAKPIIDREDYNQDRTGIRLSDQGGFKIIGIEFAHCMTGIYADYTDKVDPKSYLWIEDCYFRDSLKYQHYEDYPNRKIGLGVCLFSWERRKRIVMSDIMVKNCVFRRLASAFWTNSPDNFNKNASFVYNFGNLVFEDCLFEEGYQWQQGIRGVDGGAMRNCVTLNIGENFRSFNGVAGSMFFRCKNWVFENCEWGYVSIGLGSGDGEAFDFEGNCDNMVMRNCLFHDTDGPGFLLCCYASDGHPNKGILMENCLINGKSKRPIGLPRCAIVNTTDWTEVEWKNCRFYLSPGETLMKVMDPEKDKKSVFTKCWVRYLREAGKTPAFKATASASSGDASKAADGDVASAWLADSANEQWLQLNFDTPQTITEFRLREAAESAIQRYEIECWDAEAKAWKSSFNGMAIGADFIAPIIARTTSRARLRVIRTKAGNPALREFSAHGGVGKELNDPNGVIARRIVGK